jgi:hypothetical protein
MIGHFTGLSYWQLLESCRQLVPPQKKALLLSMRKAAV